MSTTVFQITAGSTPPATSFARVAAFGNRVFDSSSPNPTRTKVFSSALTLARAAMKLRCLSLCSTAVQRLLPAPRMPMTRVASRLSAR
jgi:hypothetical protein